MALPQEPNQR
jgi:putative transposase